jgi:hypothetical protein
MLQPASPLLACGQAGAMSEIATQDGSVRIDGFGAKAGPASLRGSVEHGGGRLAVTVFSDSVTAAEDASGALRDTLAFWRGVPEAELSGLLGSLAAGAKRDVTGRLLTKQDPWPYPAPSAPRGEGQPWAWLATFLVKPQASSPLSVALGYGEGRIRRDSRSRPGMIDEQLYLVESGPADPVIIGRLRASRHLFVHARREGPPVTNREGPAGAAIAAAVGAIDRCLAAMKINRGG